MALSLSLSPSLSVSLSLSLSPSLSLPLFLLQEIPAPYKSQHPCDADLCCRLGDMHKAALREDRATFSGIHLRSAPSLNPPPLS